MNRNVVSNTLLQKLREQYANHQFLIQQNYLDGRGENIRDIITCSNFEANHVDLEILIFEDKRVLIYIQLKNEDFKVRRQVYDLLCREEDEVEKSYPDGVLGWGNTLKRVKLFLNEGGRFHNKYPAFFKSESELVRVVLGYIEISVEVVIQRINKINDTLSSRN